MAEAKAEPIWCVMVKVPFAYEDLAVHASTPEGAMAKVYKAGYTVSGKPYQIGTYGVKFCHREVR